MPDPRQTARELLIAADEARQHPDRLKAYQQKLSEVPNPTPVLDIMAKIADNLVITTAAHRHVSYAREVDDVLSDISGLDEPWPPEQGEQ